MTDRTMRGILDSAAELLRASFTHNGIGEFFADRSIPFAEATSKRTFAFNTLDALPQARALEVILELTLQKHDVGLQEAIYALQDRGGPIISEITRREIARQIGNRLHGAGARAEKLASLFDLGDSSLSELLGVPDSGLKRQIEQNANGPSPVWTTTDVFERIGAFQCSTRRFAQLLDTALDPLLRDAAIQEALVRELDPLLRVDHHEIVQTGVVSQRKIFAVRPIQRGVEGRPKNLIFASVGVKPLLGFRDAIDNDIVVLQHADSCLVYDRPIGDGLTWSELVVWWAEREAIADEKDARRSLGLRLQQSLADGPERLLFDTYFRAFSLRLGDRLPALVPQVYLHYDPDVMRNTTDRDTLLRQRMDFLLLLPGRQRIVLEIDGKHHYADGDRASPRQYAEMVSADRELRLRGYEIYRFGGYELTHDRTSAVMEVFFERLFAVHRFF